MLEHRREVEQHADGHEEKAEQHVAEGLDVVLDLVAVLGLGDEHAGEEGAEREREPRHLRHPREPEGHQQHEEHEELGGLLARDQVEQRPHKPLPQPQHDREHHGGLHQRDPDGPRDRALGERERGHQHQERDHREVLEEQYAHHLPAVFAVQLHALGEHLGDDRGGRHREHPAHDDPLAPRDTREDRGAHAEREDRGDLQPAEAEHRAAHVVQLREAELEAHGEHQEHHAELREVALVLGRGDEGERVRADDRPDDEIAQDRRHGELAKEDHHRHGGGEQDEGHRQGVVHRGIYLYFRV